MNAHKLRQVAMLVAILLLPVTLLVWSIIQAALLQAQTGSSGTPPRWQGGMGRPRSPQAAPAGEALLLPAVTVAPLRDVPPADLPPLTARGLAPEGSLGGPGPLSPPVFQAARPLLQPPLQQATLGQPMSARLQPAPTFNPGIQLASHQIPVPDRSALGPMLPPPGAQSPRLMMAPRPGSAGPMLPPMAGTMPGGPPAPPVHFPGSAGVVSQPGQASLNLPNDANGLPNPCAQRGEVGLLDNLSLFLGLEGAQAPQDLGINSNFGGRAHLNWGIPVITPLGLGVHVGAAVNYERTAQRFLRTFEGTRERTQRFLTLGVYQQAPGGGLSWELAWDYLSENYYSGIDAMQWRGQIGYDVTECDEVGLWGTLRARSDRATVTGTTIHLRPINQVNLYWRHVWENDNVTRLWAGVAEEHGRFNLLLPSSAALQHPFSFGADVYLPLNDCLALFGEAHFITPGDTGTIAALFGVAWYPGGGAKVASRSRFAPLLPVANNTSFVLDAQP